MMDFDLLTPKETNQHFYGVTVGIVTNNKDPENLGRVKVKFPWLSDKTESQWARVVSLMAGKERGFYCLPEVDDEVLVAFEHGDMAFPYILGSLWNGKDVPPAKNDDGKNNQRLLKSRSGHKIILDDTEGEEKIIIQDKTEKNKIVIDSKNNTLSVEVEKDLTITTKGKIIIKGDDNINIECKSLSIKVQENYQLDAKQKCQITAGNCEVKGNSGLKLNCSSGVKVNNSSLEVM